GGQGSTDSAVHPGAGLPGSRRLVHTVLRHVRTTSTSDPARDERLGKKLALSRALSSSASTHRVRRFPEARQENAPRARAAESPANCVTDTVPASIQIHARPWAINSRPH